jgi:hypothetical protein
VSLPEQATKVAAGVVDSFKSQPMLLLVLIFNLAVLAIVYFGTQQTHRNQQELLKTVIASCLK